MALAADRLNAPLPKTNVQEIYGKIFKDICTSPAPAVSLTPE